MTKELIAIIPYKDVKFRWISNHWDVHLSGTCIYNGSLCEFENKYPGYDEDKDEFEEMFVKIYKLDFLTKLKWYIRQYKFEQFVGYHWTYPQRSQGKGFYYRNPKWLYKFLSKIYYKKWKNLKK